MKRRTVLVAPPGESLHVFRDVSYHRGAYEETIEAIQTFRGSVYVDGGNLAPSELWRGQRHIQPQDSKSWHLATITEQNEVEACLRISFYPRDIRFSQLAVAHSAIAASDIWGPALEDAVEDEIQEAQRRNVRFGEFGGWAISEDLRCTTEAVRMVLAACALGHLVGGFLGVSTVNRQHHSSSILRRVGAKPLIAQGCEIPPYYEPAYRSELEILQFDSSQPAAQYRERIEHCAALLGEVPVVAADRIEYLPKRRPVVMVPVRTTLKYERPQHPVERPVPIAVHNTAMFLSTMPQAPVPSYRFTDIQEYRRLSEVSRIHKVEHRAGWLAIAGAPAVGAVVAGMYLFSLAYTPEARYGDAQSEPVQAASMFSSGAGAESGRSAGNGMAGLERTQPVVSLTPPKISFEPLPENGPLAAKPFVPPPPKRRTLPEVRIEEPPAIMASLSPNWGSLFGSMPKPSAPKPGFRTRLLKVLSTPFRRTAGTATDRTRVLPSVPSMAFQPHERSRHAE